MNKLISKIKSKEAVVGIVGLGYVGLPLLIRSIEIGYNVIGFDIDKNKIEKLKNGESYIHHISEEKIKKLIDTGRFEGTTDFTKIKTVDIILLCIPTPLGKHNEPDLSYVINTVNSIVPHLRKGQLISLESTTYPGTTEEELMPRLESTGMKVGKELFLVFSPEREDPGNKNFNLQKIPKVCGGITPNCLKVGVAFYNSIVDKVVPVSSTRAAEMTKLLENIHRAVNIGLVNELKIVADAMNINIIEVIDAAATKPFGFTPYYPGPGLGGHCIPIDPFYLTWKAHEYGLNTRFIELAGEINTKITDWVVSKLMDALNNKEKALKGSNILILGLAYKKNIDDMRESPSIELIEKLRKKSAVVSYSDPYIPYFPKMREHHFDMKSIQINKETLQSFDCVLIATDHDNFDYKLIQENSSLIIDTRGVYRDSFDNVINA